MQNASVALAVRAAVREALRVTPEDSLSYATYAFFEARLRSKALQFAVTRMSLVCF